MMQTSRLDWGFEPEDVEHRTLIDRSCERSIYRCSWRHTTVCMKVIEKVDDEPIYELDVLSKTVHPHVCQFLGGCVRDHTAYMLFEFMSNGNLSEYMRKQKPSFNNKLSITLDILRGLAYLALRKPHFIIHRDIKPENIFINASGVAKIGDFGSSKLVDRSEVLAKLHTGEVGTYRWTAPEVLRSCAYDSTADMYSFGMLLRYIWSGNIPYRMYTKTVQVVFAKISNTPDDFHDLMLPNHPIVSTEIRQIVEECTDFDSKCRPCIGNLIHRIESLRADV